MWFCDYHRCLHMFVSCLNFAWLCWHWQHKTDIAHFETPKHISTRTQKHPNMHTHWNSARCMKFLFLKTEYQNLQNAIRTPQLKICSCNLSNTNGFWIQDVAFDTTHCLIYGRQCWKCVKHNVHTSDHSIRTWYESQVMGQWACARHKHRWGCESSECACRFFSKDIW